MLTPAVTGGGMSEFRTSLSSIRPEKSVDKWNQKIVQRSITMIHNHCDVVITPSRKMENQLLSWHAKSKIVTLPTGVDRLKTSEHEIAEARKRFGLAANEPVLLSVSRIGTEKNLSMTIRAFDKLSAQWPHLKLLIVGTGDDLEHFKDQASHIKAADRVIFTGLIPHAELGAIYSLATVLLFPSLTDTQGLVLNEAAHAGTPIVMIDGAVAEVLRDGENGFVARNNLRDFAAKINKILSHPKLRESMSKRGQEIAKEYSAVNQAKKLAKVYEDLLASRRADG
jgi:glycosyltransferase involved in cell wall biosynthesis